MENKYMRYGLIVVVIVVWGAIITRVVGGMSGPDVQAAAARSRPKVEAPVTREGFVLFADYPDPFIPEPDSLDEIEVKKPGAPGTVGAMGTGPMAGAMNTPPKPPPPTLQSILQYVGMIGNPDRKLKIAIINLHGKELLVKEKEKHDEVLIKKIEKDKIGVVYKGKYVEVEKEN